MPTKTISVTLEAYKRLKREKREGESFSNVIIRLTEEGEGDLMEFAGAWEDAEDIERAIAEGRRDFDKSAILP